jgi:hypothetical protein
MPHKLRIALAATVLALTAVSATTPASAFRGFWGYQTFYYYPFP